MSSPAPSSIPNSQARVDGAAQPSHGSTNGPKLGFRASLDRFWQRVTEGRQLNELWFQFRQDAKTSFSLYRRDFEAGSPREKLKEHGAFHVLQELAWAILGKLTPARRVLLLIGIVFLLLPGGGFQFHKQGSDIQLSWGDPHFWGGFALFLLLILEIADRVVMKRDLEIARDIQSWLLPATPPVIPGFTIAFAARPANTVAGDYYDAFPRPAPEPERQKFLLAVADVAGKSISPPFLFATLLGHVSRASLNPL